MKQIVFISVMAMLLNVAPLSAQHMDKDLFLTIATQGDAEQKALLSTYLRGVLNGLEAYNIESRRQGIPQMFCLPSEALLTSAWLTEILLQYLQRYSKIPSELSIAVIAHHAITEYSPCKKLINK